MCFYISWSHDHRYFYIRFAFSSLFRSENHSINTRYAHRRLSLLVNHEFHFSRLVALFAKNMEDLNRLRRRKTNKRYFPGRAVQRRLSTRWPTTIFRAQRVSIFRPICIFDNLAAYIHRARDSYIRAHIIKYTIRG